MADKQRRNLSVTDPVADKHAKALPQCRVKCRKRLVHQQNLWLGEQCAHQRRPRRLPARERCRVAVGKSGQIGRLQRRLNPRHAVTPVAGGKPEGKIVADRHMRKQKRVLKHQPDTALFGRKAGDIHPVEADAPRPLNGIIHRPADHCKQGRFSTSAWPLQKMQFASGHRHLQPLDQGRLPGIGNGQIAQLQHVGALVYECAKL